MATESLLSSVAKPRDDGIDHARRRGALQAHTQRTEIDFNVLGNWRN